MSQFPSIFNDVIGPVMRGPSSSHCAAAVRIGLLARALMEGKIESLHGAFDTGGSLATTHESQGSDMGLLGGILGIDPSNERLLSYRREIEKEGIHVRFDTGDFGDAHPNTYRLTLKNAEEVHTMVALSTGGGMIDIVELDGHRLSLRGDRHETLVYFAGSGDAVAQKASELVDDESTLEVFRGKDKGLVRISTLSLLEEGKRNALSATFGATAVRILPPVLPVLTPIKMPLPFVSCEEMLAYNETRRWNLAELALAYESARGAIGREAVLDKMVETIRIMRKALLKGLSGTRYEDRILGCQSTAFREKQVSGRLLDLGILNRAIRYVTALMENKSAMGVFVAAPTAGACGGLPVPCSLPPTRWDPVKRTSLKACWPPV